MRPCEPNIWKVYPTLSLRVPDIAESDWKFLRTLIPIMSAHEKMIVNALQPDSDFEAKEAWKVNYTPLLTCCKWI